MDDPSLWNDKDADQRVIAVLLKEINRRHPMSQLAFVEGVLVRLHSFEVVTEEELEKELAQLREDVARFESFLAQVHVSKQPEAQAAAPVVEAPAETPAPVEQPVEQPAPAPEVSPAEPTPTPEPVAQPEQPAEQPAPLPEVSAEPIVLQ